MPDAAKARGDGAPGATRIHQELVGATRSHQGPPGAHAYTYIFPVLSSMLTPINDPMLSCIFRRPYLCQFLRPTLWSCFWNILVTWTEQICQPKVRSASSYFFPCHLNSAIPLYPVGQTLQICGPHLVFPSTYRQASHTSLSSCSPHSRNINRPTMSSKAYLFPDDLIWQFAFCWSHQNTRTLCF